MIKLNKKGKEHKKRRAKGLHQRAPLVTKAVRKNAYINPLCLPTSHLLFCYSHKVHHIGPLQTLETILFAQQPPPPPWLDPSSGIEASDRGIGALGSPRFATLYCTSLSEPFLLNPLQTFVSYSFSIQ